MSGHNRDILKRILNEWPHGTVALLPWFQKFGAYRQLIKRYEEGNWIKRIGRGAYVRQNDDVDWTGGLYAVQFQQNIPVFVGGKTSLELKGYEHNIPMGKNRYVTILSSEKRKLSAWFQYASWDVTIDYHILNLFPENPSWKV